jgi:hypothetical protein
MSLTGFGEVHDCLGSLAAPSNGLPAGPQVARFRKLGWSVWASPVSSGRNGQRDPANGPPNPNS